MNARERPRRWQMRDAQAAAARDSLAGRASPLLTAVRHVRTALREFGERVLERVLLRVAASSRSCRWRSPSSLKAEVRNVYCSTAQWRFSACSSPSPSTAIPDAAACACHHCGHSPSGSLRHSVRRGAPMGPYSDASADSAKASGVACASVSRWDAVSKRSRCGASTSRAWANQSSGFQPHHARADAAEVGRLEADQAREQPVA